jgi:alanine-synthesizing transaminase
MDRTFEKSHKLDNVCYDIRGPALKEAKRLEEEGYHILKLNIGNPAVFGFNAPDEVIHDMILNLHNAQGYSDSQGLFSARKAIMQYCQQKGIPDVGIDDVYLGNGVSELIQMSMNGLLDSGDEILVPAPDYPLWTGAVTLSGGNAVHYRCDEGADWYPDLEDIRAKVTDRTKGIVLINPNNPTGAVYPPEVLKEVAQIAREHDLIIFSDEIYDKILYDGITHTSIAALAPDLLTVTFNGISKAYRAAGFRAGWMVLSGNKACASGYREGLEMLCNMRICANVPAQFTIQTALGGFQSINNLLLPGGRLREQRDVCCEMLARIPGVSCVKPKGALYAFPRIDVKKYRINDDEKMILDLLIEKKILVVQGTGFNWPDPDHIRIVFLPDTDTLREAIGRFGDFLSDYSQY